MLRVCCYLGKCALCQSYILSIFNFRCYELYVDIVKCMHSRMVNIIPCMWKISETHSMEDTICACSLINTWVAVPVGNGGSGEVAMVAVWHYRNGWEPNQMLIVLSTKLCMFCALANTMRTRAKPLPFPSLTVLVSYSARFFFFFYFTIIFFRLLLRRFKPKNKMNT